MDNEQKQNQIQIEIPKEEMQGHYANMAVVAHSANDFFIDMILRAPNTPKARVQSRIIMTPEHAKELMLALQNNVNIYEQHFGEIDLRKGMNTPTDGIMDFPLPKGQA